MQPMPYCSLWQRTEHKNVFIKSPGFTFQKDRMEFGELGLSVFFQEDTDITHKISWKYGK